MEKRDQHQLVVYVAGSSDPQERGRVMTAMSMVKGHPHMRLALDWVQAIENAGGVRNEGLTYAQREDAAQTAITSVLASDAVWLLVPNSLSRGAWYEGGIASGWNASGGRKISVYASGPTQRSIFCALLSEFETDADAFVALSHRANKLAMLS